jgi:hypothetical protein
MSGGDTSCHGNTGDDCGGGGGGTESEQLCNQSGTENHKYLMSGPERRICFLVGQNGKKGIITIFSKAKMYFCRLYVAYRLYKEFCSSFGSYILSMYS